MFLLGIADAAQKVMHAMAALDALVDAADADTRIRALRVREELGRKLEFENLGR